MVVSGGPGRTHARSRACTGKTQRVDSRRDAFRLVREESFSVLRGNARFSKAVALMGWGGTAWPIQFGARDILWTLTPVTAARLCLYPEQRKVAWDDPDRHRRPPGWRPLGPRLRGRRQQRQPRCPVLHRRDQRRGKRAVRCHSRSLNGRRWSRQPLYADLMEWGTAGLHGSEQVADINRNARPTSSALWVRSFRSRTDLAWTRCSCALLP